MEREARAMAGVCRTDDAWTGVTEVAASHTGVPGPLSADRRRFVPGPDQPDRVGWV